MQTTVRLLLDQARVAQGWVSNIRREQFGVVLLCICDVMDVSVILYGRRRYIKAMHLMAPLKKQFCDRPADSARGSRDHYHHNIRPFISIPQRI